MRDLFRLSFLDPASEKRLICTATLSAVRDDTIWFFNLVNNIKIKETVTDFATVSF
jgi:hypothetical protein